MRWIWSTRIFPSAPTAGQTGKDYWEIMDEYMGDGDETEFECGACGGSVVVEIHMSLNFSTRS